MLTTDQVIAIVEALVKVIALRNGLANTAQIQACDLAMQKLHALLSA